jgi:hypothetical protein
MKTLYIECNMGAAGDMLMAALLELCPEPEKMVTKLNALHIPKVAYEMEQSVKCGITGTHVRVLVDGAEEKAEDVEHHHDSHHENHHHTGMQEIVSLIEHLDLPEKVKQDATAVYRLIAQAEGHVHNQPVEKIHFHEVGNMDAVADVVGVCYLLHELAPEKIITSPIHVGNGQVRCAHGILPVPAPATAYLLKGVPIYSGEIRGELCTPTGAALLKYFSSEFGAMPVMQIEKIGYGMGTKDFEAANCVRVMLGES